MTNTNTTDSNARRKALVDRIMLRWQAAQAERGPWLGLWQQMADYVRPNRSTVKGRMDAPSLAGFESVFDGTAISANMTLASGCMSRLTPAQTPWFAFDPPRELRQSDAAKRWYAECSEIALEALATSNFYTELHEAYLDRGAFGTCCLHVEGTMKHPLNFKAHDIGTYAFLNGADGMVDTVFRELTYTAREAAQVYEVKELPECLQRVLQDPGSSQQGERHDFLHVIYPREDAERDGSKMDGANKPIASVHIHVKTRTIVRVGGYEEMPTIGSRYLRWGTGAYGICPTWQALPEARQLNELQKNLDVLAEVAAFPRLLLPDDMEGEVDLRATGTTYFKDPNRVPREWLTQGRYDVGLDRVKARQEAIKSAFHVELFQMWAAITKQMTAYEVGERAQEKVELFSPTFTLLSTEMYGPILRRVFSLLMRQGVFPMPPEEAVHQNERGMWAVSDPKLRYTSRLALALKAVNNQALNRVLGMMGPVMQFNPAVADNLNWDVAMRDIALNEGVPVEWMPSEDEVGQLRQARAEAQMQAEAMAAGVPQGAGGAKG